MFPSSTGLIRCIFVQKTLIFFKINNKEGIQLQKKHSHYSNLCGRKKSTGIRFFSLSVYWSACLFFRPNCPKISKFLNRYLVLTVFK